MNARESKYQSDYDDEIDLLELIPVLWQGKWIIIGATLAAGLLAFFALQAMPSVYRVETTLDTPSQYDIQALQPSTLVGEYNVLPSILVQEYGGQGREHSTGSPGEAYQIYQQYQVGPLNVESIYKTGLVHADSLYVKKAFWQQRADHPLTEVRPGATSVENDRAFRAFANGFQVASVAGNEGTSLRRMVLETEEPAVDTKLLAEYLNFVDRHTVEQFIGQLQMAYQANLGQLMEDMEAIHERELVKLQDELVRLDEAYQLASSLGISETPYEQAQNVERLILDSRLYLLGTKALGQEISALKERQKGRLEAYAPQLRTMEHWRRQIQSDLRHLEDIGQEVSAFVVVSPPEPSLEPVRPNRSLIFVAALVGGGILGVLLVFFMHGIASYRARQSGVPDSSQSDA